VNFILPRLATCTKFCWEVYHAVTSVHLDGACQIADTNTSAILFSQVGGRAFFGLLFCGQHSSCHFQASLVRLGSRSAISAQGSQNELHLPVLDSSKQLLNFRWVAKKHLALVVLLKSRTTRR